LYPRLLQRAYLLNSALDRLVLQAQPSPWWRNDKRGLITAALNDAVAALADQLGPGPAQWRLDQRLHVALRHQIALAVPALGWLFNRPDVPWGGSSATVGRARYSYARPFEVDTAATVRAVAKMTAAPRLLSVIPGGQSGHPLSPHYADQFPAWLAGELYPIAPRAPAASTGQLTLLPQ
jgi:penicillin amidase